MDILFRVLTLWLQAGQAQATPTPSIDFVSLVSSGGAFGVLVFFTYSFLIKNPPLFITWREHRDTVDPLLVTIKKLNEQQDRNIRVAEMQAERIPEGGGSKGRVRGRDPSRDECYDDDIDGDNDTHPTNPSSPSRYKEASRTKRQTRLNRDRAERTERNERATHEQAGGGV